MGRPEIAGVRRKSYKNRQDVTRKITILELKINVMRVVLGELPSPRRSGNRLCRNHGTEPICRLEVVALKPHRRTMTLTVKIIPCLLAVAFIAFAPVVIAGAASADTKGCPPGLAKQNPPCVPPGQAKKGVTADQL